MCILSYSAVLYFPEHPT